MGSFFSTAIQILHSGSGDLILRFPPEYLPAIPLAVLAFPFAIGLVISIRHTGFKLQSILLMLVTFIPLAIFFYLVTGSSTVEFSKTNQNLVIENHVFFRTSRSAYPLADVDHAEVQEDDGHSHMLYIALTSGERVPTGNGWSARKGHFQAADAVNQFLGQVKGSFQPAGGLRPPPSRYDGKTADEVGREIIEQAMQKQKQAQQ